MTSQAFISQEVSSLEAKRLVQQIELDACLSSGQRNEMGQFATPPALANAIAKAVATLWGDGQIRFFEPALGTGAFYAALLRNFPQDKIISATGVERDQRYANVAQQVWGEAGLKVTTADFMGLTHP